MKPAYLGILIPLLIILTLATIIGIIIWRSQTSVSRTAGRRGDSTGSGEEV